MSVFDEATAEAINATIKKLQDLGSRYQSGYQPFGNDGPTLGEIYQLVSLLRSADSIADARARDMKTIEESAIFHSEVATKKAKTIERLREALGDIARGPLQSPDFEKYAVKKAKNALKIGD